MKEKKEENFVDNNLNGFQTKAVSNGPKFMINTGATNSTGMLPYIFWFFSWVIDSLLFLTS